MKIEKPIFIIGAGRSGTTIFYGLFAGHPELCWFSNLSDKFPGIRILPFFHKILDVPLLGEKVKKHMLALPRKQLRPNEGGRIYHDYCGIENKKKLTEDDWNAGMEKHLKCIIRDHLRLTGKPRFLSKQTANTQRIRLINRIFPDALYIHVIRDGRAVANSLYRVPFWNRIDIWWLGIKSADWEAMGREKIELCGLHWRHNVEEILDNRHIFGDRYLEIKYEDFLKNPRAIFQRIIAFCELTQDRQFLNTLPERLPDMNYKWQSQLTEKEQQVLFETIGPLMRRLNYAF